MNKKIIISLGIIGAVAAIVVGATVAYYNDTETSTGNIFVAGALDLKVDHLRQTYNDVDCKTCSVTVISDETNIVVEKNGSSVTPYPAVPAWVHTAWTAQNDPALVAAGANNSEPVPALVASGDTVIVSGIVMNSPFEGVDP